MKITKKNNLFFILIMLGAPHSLHTMDQPKPKKKTSKPRHAVRWIALAGEIILGNTPIEQLLVQQPNEPFPFTNLPKDEQNFILNLLTTGANTTSLSIAAHTINSLAQVNTALNTLINQPAFCLRMIKNLSKRFNCSNFTACAALQTFQAKHQLRLQRQLVDLCEAKIPSRNTLNILCDQGVDLEFTYDYKQQEVIPLMIASLNESPVVVFLIETGVDINQTNNMGLTTLMFLVKTNEWWDSQLLIRKPWVAIQWLLDNQKLIINQQDSNGNTALMHAVYNDINPVALDTIRLLLNAGANPHIANNNGVTPLQAALQIGNQAIIDLIQNTIIERNKRL